MPTKPAVRNLAIFRQFCELIPPHLVAKLAREHQVSSRGISPWSHVVALLYAQFTHSLGRNDVCDALAANRGTLASIRGAAPPSRNGLSHANRTRSPAMAEALFWQMLSYLEQQYPGAGGSAFRRLPRRFRRTVHVLDATTIRLFANCMDWAKHRRRKAAAKLHLRLNLESFLPAFAVVESAKGHDSTKAHVLCAGLKSREIVVSDMAYINYAHLNELDDRGVFWVSRVKENMRLRCVKILLAKPQGNILRDDIVVVENPQKRQDYPKRFRRVVALVEVRNELREMTFFTNNLEWAASSICELYKARWNIKVFFRQIKQTLHIGDFLGHSRKAIEWQVWTALLMYVLLCFLHTCSNRVHSFTRLSPCLRAVLWQRRYLFDYLPSYGTAGSSFRMQWEPQEAFLPGFG